MNYFMTNWKVVIKLLSFKAHVSTRYYCSFYRLDKRALICCWHQWFIFENSATWSCSVRNTNHEKGKDGQKSMKKSIYWRQRQYVDNYLLNLITQGETFHVINISWYSVKVYHKFCSYNINSSFSARSIYKGVTRTLLYVSNKNLQLPRSSIVHVWHFQWQKFEALYLDNRFFKMYRFLCQKYYDINLEDTYEIILGAK